MDRNTEIHAIGMRLVKLRQKLQAREGIPGYEKNCRALRTEIARLETAPVPTEQAMDEAWETAKAARESTASSGDTTPSETATGVTAPSGGLEDPETGGGRSPRG